MSKISTRLTKRLNLKVPIVSAPMAFAASPEMASTVTAHGGFGFIGAGFTSSEGLKKDYEVARQRLNIKAGDPVPMGVGFIGWILESTEKSDDPRIPALLAEKPQAVWLAFGVDLGKYVKQIREYDAKREHKTLIFVIVNSVEEALVASNEWKVDVLVVQGIEAGGHGGGYAPSLTTLLLAVLQAIPKDGPLIVAAGGITTGSQIAAVLTMGADGVVIGTRLLCTSECRYSPGAKETILQAGYDSTVRTLAFDEVGRTMGWPPRYDGRAVANAIWDDVKAGLSLEERLKKFDESKAKGEIDRLVVWAGVGVAHINSLSTTAEVMEQLRGETFAALEEASKLISE